MTGLTFIAAWHIVDPARGFNRLRDEAAEDLARLAAAAGVRIDGPVTWDGRGGNLLCAHAPAVCLAGGGTTVNPTTSTAARRLAVWWLAAREQLGTTAIADRLGISEAAVVKARTANPLAATEPARRTYRGNAASAALRAKVAHRTNPS